MSSLIFDAEKDSATSMNVGTPPVVIAVSLCVVTVGGSERNLYVPPGKRVGKVRRGRKS